MDETALKGTFSRNHDRETLSAWAIVIGLLFEAIVLVWFAKPDGWLETSLLMGATLVIAAGVWGEIHFGNKAAAAALELQRLSDEKIAALNLQAAEANARALEAQVALEKFRKPWTLPVWMLPDFEKLLKPYAGTPYRIFATGDHDASRIAQILKRSFDWAQWTGTPVMSLRLMDGVELMPDFNGIDIRIDKTRESEWLAAAQAVAEVFKSAEIDVAARVMESGTPADAVHIFIGRKV